MYRTRLAFDSINLNSTFRTSRLIPIGKEHRIDRNRMKRETILTWKKYRYNHRSDLKLRLNQTDIHWSFGQECVVRFKYLYSSPGDVYFQDASKRVGNGTQVIADVNIVEHKVMPWVQWKVELSVLIFVACDNKPIDTIYEDVEAED